MKILLFLTATLLTLLTIDPYLWMLGLQPL